MQSNIKNNIQNLSILKTNEVSYGYYEIDYLDKKLLLRQHDNYINISKILATNNSSFKDWHRNKSSKELVEEIFELINGHKRISPKPIDETILDIEPLYYIEGSNNIKGTYVHQLLAPHILSWLSPKIAVKVSMIVNKYLVDEKDRKIFDLEALNQRMEERHKESMNKLSNLENQNNLLLTKNDCLLDKTNNLENKITNNNIKTNNASKQFTEQINKLTISTPPEKKRDIHYFVILAKQDGGYYCIRRKYDTLTSEIKRVGGKILFCIQTVNAITLYDSLKNSGIVDYCINNFRIKIKYNQEDLIKFIRDKLQEIGEPIENIKSSIDDLKIDLDEE